jgi:hypothetical protein
VFAFDNKITLGTLVTVATVAVGGVWFWSQVESRVSAIANNDIKQDQRLEGLANTMGDMRQLQAEQGVDIRYIRNFVEEERRSARSRAALNE